MTPELWAEIERHYHEIVDLAEEEREVRLNAIADEKVRREVMAMIDGGSVDAQQIASAVNTVAVQAAYLDQRLGPWRITGIIGRGGMGAVYAGLRDDNAFEKKVAIKMLHAGIGGTALGRFRQERDILATLDHPNIAHLIDAGETEWGVPYIVMEYVDGRPVTAWCAEHKLSADGILRLFPASAVPSSTRIRSWLSTAI
jgi:serine/threonine protein kinase